MSMITFCHALKRSPSTSIGLFILSSLVIIAIFAPWLAPQDPNWQNAADRLLPPGAHHWLGTDSYGRDMLSRLI
jgi:peptide/nickel transport system permease protein